MTNEEKYLNAFKEVLNVSDKQISSLTYQGVQNWDSVGHMALIAELEEIFDIMMDTDDIIDFSSYNKGIEILSTKYNVEFK